MIADAIGALFSRSIENPQVPLSEAAELLGGGTQSSAGVRVSRETALTLSAFWRGSNVIARDVAKVPVHVYRRIDDRDRERDRRHPAYRLLRRRPCDDMTAFVWKQTIVGHAVTEGNGYAYIERDGSGRPTQLIPLLPDRTFTSRINRRLWYVTQIGDERTPRWLEPIEVFHLKHFSPDGTTGYNVIQKAKESLGWGIAMRRYSSVFFANGARSAGVLMTPGNIGLDEDEAKRLIQSFNAKQQGLENAHKTILLEDGTKYVPNTIKQDEAQFLESMNFSLLDVANWLLLAPHKVGHPGRTSYSSLEQENQSHLDEAIDPWMVNFEEEADAKLLSEEEIRDETHYCEFNRDALVKVDFDKRIDAQNRQIEHGILSPDEVRAMQNRGPRPDGLGSRYWMPGNMLYADAKPTAEEPADPVDEEPAADTPAASDAVRAVVAEAAGRVAKRWANELRRVAKKPESFAEWLDTRAADLEAISAEILGPALGLVDPARRSTVAAGLAETRQRLRDLARSTDAADLAAALECEAAATERGVPAALADLILDPNP